MSTNSNTNYKTWPFGQKSSSRMATKYCFKQPLLTTANQTVWKSNANANYVLMMCHGHIVNKIKPHQIPAWRYSTSIDLGAAT